MKIAGFKGKLQDFTLLRSLTADEVAQHRLFTPVVAEARERLKLFRILAHNYKEWKEYVYSLFTLTIKGDDNEVFHLDRLLLNYLTCAYTIRQHFEVSYKQRFRSDSGKLKSYNDFIQKLCRLSWGFAFFLDFRGYVQHRGLGIGAFSRKITPTSVRLIITHSPKQLLQGSRDWSFSQLSADRGPLDIVRLLDEFHIQMLQNYAPFVSQVFYPELKPADQFYRGLTAELHARKPGYKMVFATKYPNFEKMRKSLTPTAFQLKFSEVANDLYAELGFLAGTQTPPPEPLATK